MTKNGEHKKNRLTTIILLRWFKEAHAANVPVNGTKLRKKFPEIIKVFAGFEDFTASSGLIGRMKKRHKLVYSSLSAESLSVNEATIETR